LLLHHAQTQTRVQQQFCAEDIELRGTSADVVVDLQILPRLLHISCAVVAIAPATTTVTDCHKLKQLEQQLGAVYSYNTVPDTTAAATAAAAAAAAATAAAATAAAAAAAVTAAPDVCILLRNGHYELLVPNGRAWSNGHQLTVCTYHFTMR
jgi:hypothetical protein